MKRPSFQFYPADWTGNAKLRRCSDAARGAWMSLLCALHDSDEYGVLRWPLDEVARSAGVSLKLARELSAKGVLKGADAGCEPFVYTPFHAGKSGDPVVLIEKSDESCWYSSRMVRDEYLRKKRGGNTRFSEENQPSQPSPKGGTGGRKVHGASSSSSSSLPLPKGNGHAEAVPLFPEQAPLAKPKSKSEEVRYEYFDRGKGLLGPSSGGILSNLLKLYDGNVHKARAKLEDCADKRDRAAWINAFLLASKDGWGKNIQVTDGGIL